MSDIVEIRILPPLAIGRLGSSATPLENYTMEIANPVGHRSLVPASTLVVDPGTGAVVSATAPTSVSFRDAQGNIKPVCPFLEIWMLLAGAKTLTPLTLQALKSLNADETDVSWSVDVGNIKESNPPPSRPPSTEPGGIYANVGGVSRGYLDDECDGMVQVQVTLLGETLTAVARITCGPPNFAPDGLPIRTVADELEQIELGPSVSGPVPMAEVGSIVRRALETVRLMNTAALNSPSVNSMASQDTGTGRAAEPIFDPSVVDALAIRARHESVLLALNSGTMAWFSSVLRRYTEVGDLSDAGRRKMPGMMRGADGAHLALTRRQTSKIDAALEIAPEGPASDSSPDTLTPTNLSAILYHAQGNPPVAHPSSAISNAFPGLEMDFRNVWRRVFVGIVLHEADNFVVDVDPNASAKLRALIGQRVISVNGVSVIGVLQGPTLPRGPVVPLPPNENATANDPMAGKTNLEWSNCLADALQMQGKSVNCVFFPKAEGRRPRYPSRSDHSLRLAPASSNVNCWSLAS